LYTQERGREAGIPPLHTHRETGRRIYHPTHTRRQGGVYTTLYTQGGYEAGIYHHIHPGRLGGGYTTLYTPWEAREALGSLS